LPGGSTEIVTTPGARNSDRFPTYGRVDVKASRTFPLSGGRLRLDLEIANLTNRKNACCVDEFLFTTRADGSIEAEPDLDDWLGFRPSFNVRWEF